jgi:hypothetical protein
MPVAVEPEMRTETGWDVASDGTLVYVSGGVSTNERRLVCVDRQGRKHQNPRRRATMPFHDCRRNGTRVALYIPNQEVDIWLWDSCESGVQRATFDPGVDIFPVWSPTAAGLIFQLSCGQDSVNLFEQAADGSGDVTRSDHESQCSTRHVCDPRRHAPSVYAETARTTGRDIMQLPTGRHACSDDAGATTPFTERNAEVSPMAAGLPTKRDKLRRFNIYVRAFPNVSSGYWQVSTDGGTRPLWARDSTRAVLSEHDGADMRVGVPPGPTWAATAATKLFEGRYGASANQEWPDNTTIARNGKRFLMIKAARSGPDGRACEPRRGVQNWW